MAEKKENYIIDVANERTYQNQSDDYYKEYSKWRSNENNAYGYRFVHDTREHSYVDGEGYLQKKADVAEKIAMYKCLGLLGVVLIIILGFDVIRYFTLNTWTTDLNDDAVYFSDMMAGKNGSSITSVIVCGLFSVVRLSAALLVFRLVTKIPAKVAYPRGSGNDKFVGSGVVIMLMIMVIGRICFYLIWRFFSLAGIDTLYTNMVYSDSIVTNITYVIINCIIVSIIRELLFRGVILQTFRQFGDTYAIFVSCIAYGLTFNDISSIGYGILCGFVLGLFTIKTGTLKTPIYMQIFSAITNYLLSCVAVISSTHGRLMEVAIATLILIMSVIVFSRLISNGKWCFSINSEHSQMSFTKKIMMFFTTTSIAVWIVAGIILFIVSLRWL